MKFLSAVIVSFLLATNVIASELNKPHAEISADESATLAKFYRETFFRLNAALYECKTETLSNVFAFPTVDGELESYENVNELLTNFIRGDTNRCDKTRNVFESDEAYVERILRAKIPAYKAKKPAFVFEVYEEVDIFEMKNFRIRDFINLGDRKVVIVRASDTIMSFLMFVENGKVIGFIKE